MVQFCCGREDCKGAEAPHKFRRFRDLDTGPPGGIYSLVLQDINGTAIHPVEVGPPPSRANL